MDPSAVRPAVPPPEMTMRPTFSSWPTWLAAPALGAAIGLPVLGAGGRVAMRAIAILTGAPSALTVGGTMTVLLMGAVSGAGGGLIYVVLLRAVPPTLRYARHVRGALFAGALVLLTLRGL